MAEELWTGPRDSTTDLLAANYRAWSQSLYTRGESTEFLIFFCNESVHCYSDITLLISTKFYFWYVYLGIYRRGLWILSSYIYVFISYQMCVNFCLLCQFLRVTLQRQPCERLLASPKRQLIHEGPLTLLGSCALHHCYSSQVAWNDNPLQLIPKSKLITFC